MTKLYNSDINIYHEDSVQNNNRLSLNGIVDPLSNLLHELLDTWFSASLISRPLDLDFVHAGWCALLIEGDPIDIILEMTICYEAVEFARIRYSCGSAWLFFFPVCSECCSHCDSNTTHLSNITLQERIQCHYIMCIHECPLCVLFWIVSSMVLYMWEGRLWTAYTIHCEALKWTF